MQHDIKTIRDFEANPKIEKIIESWAQNSGFIESILPRQIGSEDLVYCFALDEGSTKTLLTINILDDKVHLETWTEKSIVNNTLLKSSINDLLAMLGQNSIN